MDVVRIVRIGQGSQPVSFIQPKPPNNQAFAVTGCCSAKPVVTGYWLTVSMQKEEPKRLNGPKSPLAFDVDGGVRLHRPAFITDTFVDV